MQTVNELKIQKVVNDFLFKQLSKEKLVLYNKELWVLDVKTNEWFFYINFEKNESYWNYYKIVDLFKIFNFDCPLMSEVFKTFVNLFVKKINCCKENCNEIDNFYMIVSISFNSSLRIVVKEGRVLEQSTI